jgi:hypothetical protein
MRLLEWKSDGDFSLTEDLTNNIPPYAILSHTWGSNGEEVTFKDITGHTGKNKPGYAKIQFCGNQAANDGLQYFWVDTCCINKSSSAELTEAINSMFRWYREAAKCYVYLSDVSKGNYDEYDHLSRSIWKSAFCGSRWFTRGWTLQELIAPISVEFYSSEGMRLGDKRSMEQQIHEITSIPVRALRGNPLSDFSFEERLSWATKRETTREEDKAYSLLGIFDIYMPLIYGEGGENAFKRLRKKIDKPLKGLLQQQALIQLEKGDRECIQHLRLTDPRDDKMRIEEAKGGLLEDSYLWILGNSDFQQWRNDQQSRLLWIKGDPGKGKTMLLCGIANEVKKSMAKTDLLSYFFCQATDSRINNATAVLRGLVYLLVDQQRSLVSHIRKKYDHAGETLFEDANAWVALSEIFTNILQDPSLNSIYLIIDALDECVTDLPRLLDLIIQNSSTYSHVKWIVSSRNRIDIEQRLSLDKSRMRLNLELKGNAELVSYAVGAYINNCISKLPAIQDDITLQDEVRAIMQRKANGTFLWVSLVVKELKEATSWDILEVIDEMPTELKDVYLQMMQQIQGLRRGNPEFCRSILSTVAAAYRPLHLLELGVLSGLPGKILSANESIAKIVNMCGSFLTIQDGIVYIIHQSAKDFLSTDTSSTIFPSGIEGVHHTIFSRSLQVMSGLLRRDMYGLVAPGFPIDKVKRPDRDPLATARYSCVYWVDHLHEWYFSNSARSSDDLEDGSVLHNFLRQRYLYWLEALSLLKSMSKGVLSMAKLEALIQVI